MANYLLPKRTTKVFLFLWLALCLAMESFAFINTISTGGSFGSVSITEESGKVEVYSLGGFSGGIGSYQTINDHFGFIVEFSVLVDYASSQIARQAADAGIFWHLLGGAGNVARDYGAIKVEQEELNGLSLFLKSGLHNYTASDPNNTQVAIKAGVLQITAGISYTNRFDDDFFWGIKLSSGVKDFTTSLPRASTSFVGGSLFIKI